MAEFDYGSATETLRQAFNNYEVFGLYCAANALAAKLEGDKVLSSYLFICAKVEGHSSPMERVIMLLRAMHKAAIEEDEGDAAARSFIAVALPLLMGFSKSRSDRKDLSFDVVSTIQAWANGEDDPRIAGLGFTGINLAGSSKSKCAGLIARSVQLIHSELSSKDRDEMLERTIITITHIDAAMRRNENQP